MALIALRHPEGDVRHLIEHALSRLGHVIVDDGSEARADVLVLEPASAPDLEAARLLREARPDLPIVCVSISPPFPETLELEPEAYLMKPFTVAGLRSTVEGVLARELRGLQPC
jgi:DNA-binding NarL/FixJ family response regulator